MQIIEKNINELIPYEKNPRKNDQSVDKVAQSIDQFGFRVPVVIDKNNVIVCGHTRYKAAQKLQLGSVPCVVADDLTDEQIKAYRLADNKVGEDSEWDVGLLNDELSEILNIDMSEFGFDLFSIDDMNIINGYDEENDSRDTFSKTFTFPIEKKSQIICYLKKHQNEIVAKIIKDSEND